MEHSKKSSALGKIRLEENDDAERLLKSLEAQLAKAVEKGNSYKNMIREKDQRIRKLATGLEKKERLLNLCMNNDNEVYVTFGADGQRIFDIRNRQKIPFWIKTEQLSPLIHENSEEDHDDIKEEADIEEDDCTLVDVVPLSQTSVVNLIEDNQQNSNVDDSGICDNFMERIDDSSFTVSSTSKSKLRSKEASEYFSELPSSSSSRSYKRSISPTPFSSFSSIHQQELNEKSSLTSKEKKLKLEDEKETRSNYSSGSSKTRKAVQFPLQSAARFVPVNSSENVLEIPEILRYNFGTSDFELGECPIGLKFWFDSENSQCTKFFLKLHNDSENWRRDRKFVLIEQINLCYPKFHYLKFSEILEKLNNSSDKRIWLHVRDFDLFSPAGQKVLGESIEKSITHFSFGAVLYSKDELKSHLLLDFIFGHLPSLEYLSVNNGMIRPFDTEKGEPRLVKKLRKLKTLRLIFSKAKFPMSIFTTLLKRSPNLESVYGIPLSSLQKLSTANLLKDQLKICSVYIQRSNYRLSEHAALNFLEDLKFLSSSSSRSSFNNWNSLEFFEAQTFFLQCTFSILSRSMSAMAKVLQRHGNSIRKLKLEPFHDCNKMLKLFPLKNLTTLQFDVNRRRGFDKEQTSFFPQGFDFTENFPALNSIEILRDFNNFNFNFSLRETALDLFDELFPPDIFKAGEESFNRVKSLKFHGFASAFCMPRLAQLLPNVQVLRLYCDLIDAAGLLPQFYKHWPRLEQLHLELNVDIEHGNTQGLKSNFKLITEF